MAKVIGTPAERSFKIPVCRIDSDHRVVHMKDGWTCLDCLDEWGQEQWASERSLGGVELPKGVQDTRFKLSNAMPNRRARRRFR